MHKNMRHLSKSFEFLNSINNKSKFIETDEGKVQKHKPRVSYNGAYVTA